MLRRGGGKAEKLLLAGFCLLFASALISPFARMTMQQLMQSDLSNQDISWKYSVYFGLPQAVISLGALVCLLRGFWLRFQPRPREGAA
jgi:hypothetical protein